MNGHDDLHVYPLDDLRAHVLDRSCWCHPTPADDGPRVMVHHSLDGREAFERGERKPS